ncbi:MAG: translation elongation factor Ts [Gammaproteobacteria bacterium]|nr:translation elongation factor Ts [Gammaproteobacteria bacterium]MDH3370894.1 translation elongation factor Ts [Gammaproteobacteria bacterium]MDH3405435.1 translation elongation factor Ts [Gammaproteobacteria bacterium]
MTISAQQVKELRERTGLGMMECKAALTEAGGDMDAAADLLRKRAGAKIEKKSGRIAAEGTINIFVSPDHKTAAMVEVNCETDFVAKGEEFLAFAASTAARVANKQPADVDALYALPGGNGTPGTLAQMREGLVMKLGEKINVRRFENMSADKGLIGSYVHHGSKIGALVLLEGGDETLARDIAMHIAASRPEYISKEQVPVAAIAKEKEIFSEQAKDSGKSPEIIEKMVMGRVNKHLNEITLLGQPFVKDPDTTVDKLLKSKGAIVKDFIRFEVGEGLEKRSNNFAAEVMATAKGA